jgi:hypothetical protein
MSFKCVREEILAYCYDGPTQIETIIDIVKKFNADNNTQQAFNEAGEILCNLMNAGLLIPLEERISFKTSATGTAMAEDLLKANQMYDYLKF